MLLNAHARFARWSTVCALALLTACDDAPPSAPPVDASRIEEDPTPPEGLVLEGSDLLQWDTVTPEFTVPIAGTSAAVAGVLTTPRGKRRIELREGPSTRVLAESGWNFPAAGVLAPSGERVVCWNTATGPERSNGRPPHPTRGVALRCVAVTSSAVSAVFDASSPGMVATWLQDLSVRDGRVALRFLRDRSGWLVVPDLSVAGTWERALTPSAASISAGEATLVEPFVSQP